MYHVAICDDDKVFISYIRKILNQARGTNQYQFKIYEFYSGEELVSSLDTSIHIDLHHFTTFLKNKITYKALSGV